MKTPNTSLATIEARFMEVDSIANEFLALNETGTASFGRAIQTATAIRSLRELLNETTMAPIMDLMNSPLGFRTDKDPSRPVYKNGRQEFPEPYAVAIVRDCVIEATLRGVPLVGNNFNIIGGRMYVTKEGFGTLLKRIKGFTDLKIIPGVPKTVGEGALVEMVARWKIDGKDCELTRTIPVRVNSGMGTDAILGKAERKMKGAVYNQVTGSELTDGDAEEAALSGAKAANVTGDTTTKVAAPPAKTNTQAKEAPGTPSSTGHTQSGPEPASAGKGAASAEADPGPFGAGGGEPKATPLEGLGNLIKATPGVSEDAVVAYCVREQGIDSASKVLEDIPPTVLGALIENWATVVERMRVPTTPPADSDLQTKLRQLLADEEITEDRLIDWCMGKKFVGATASSIKDVPETRVVWLLNNIVKNKAAILAGPKVDK